MDFTFSISSSSVTEISSADNMTSLVSNIGVNVLVKNDGNLKLVFGSDLMNPVV